MLVFRPVNKEELFNLHHASARNVIERIFSVLMRRFRILLISPEYKMQIQARVPAALCAIHNFIRAHDPHEGPLPHAATIDDNPINQGLPNNTYTGKNEGAGVDTGAYASSNVFRECIATQMWEDYKRYIQEHGLAEDDYLSDVAEEHNFEHEAEFVDIEAEDTDIGAENADI
jgi:hypothetical protein